LFLAAFLICIISLVDTTFNRPIVESPILYQQMSTRVTTIGGDNDKDEEEGLLLTRNRHRSSQASGTNTGSGSGSGRSGSESGMSSKHSINNSSTSNKNKCCLSENKLLMVILCCFVLVPVMFLARRSPPPVVAELKRRPNLSLSPWPTIPFYVGSDRQNGGPLPPNEQLLEMSLSMLAENDDDHNGTLIGYSYFETPMAILNLAFFITVCILVTCLPACCVHCCGKG
jgi:hypothetical protein